MFEQQASSPSKKDPALLSVSERKALFEKNKGAALIPKAAFGMAAPIAEKETPKVKPASPVKSTPTVKTVTAQPKLGSPMKSSKEDKVDSPATASIKQSGGIASKVRALLEKKATISQTQIACGVKEQRQKEMNLLLNRFNQQKDDNEESEEENDSEEEIDEENISETTKMISDKSAKIVQFKGSNAELSPPPPPPPLPIIKASATKRRSIYLFL